MKGRGKMKNVGDRKSVRGGKSKRQIREKETKEGSKYGEGEREKKDMDEEGREAKEKIYITINDKT